MEESKKMAEVEVVVRNIEKERNRLKKYQEKLGKRKVGVNDRYSKDIFRLCYGTDSGVSSRTISECRLPY